MEFFIYAKDEDHALELAGNGADSEFESIEDATFRMDREVHAERKLFRITCEEANL